MKKPLLILLAFACAAVVAHSLSNVWERALATYVWSETSPDGCIRLDAFEAFRVLPSMFHRIPHPDPEIRNPVGMRWEGAIFKKAYEVETGILLGESIVYDPAASDNFTYWGDPDSGGRRIVEANGFPLVDSSRCSDPKTLAKLRRYYQKSQKDMAAKLKKLKLD